MEDSPVTFELRCFDEDVGVNDLIGVAYVTMNKFIHHPNDKHVLEVRKRELQFTAKKTSLYYYDWILHLTYL